MDPAVIGILACLLLALLGVVVLLVIFMRQALRDRTESTHQISPEESAAIQQAAKAHDQQVKAQFGEIFTPGATFDASQVAPRLQQVREDYVAELHARPKPSRHHAGLVTAAKRSLGALPYFRERAESDATARERVQESPPESGSRRDSYFG